MLYLAYGSNLNLKMMKNRLKKVKVVGTYILKDYKLVCDSYLSVIPYKNSNVSCGIFEIDENDELLLDEYEAYPSLYHKEYIDGMLIYIKNEIKEYKPSKKYIESCIEGYKDFNFDLNILNELFKIVSKNSHFLK